MGHRGRKAEESRAGYPTWLALCLSRQFRLAWLVDDAVDCYLGLDQDAENVYIVTTMAPPAFEREDEQKVMIGFGDEVSAVAAFLQHFDDPRFFGGMQAMPVTEFRRKVRVADGEMVKSCPAVVFRKSTRLEPRLRRDGVRQRYLVRVDAGHPDDGGGLPAVPPDSSYITTLGEAEEYWKAHFESRNPATIKVRNGMRAYGIVVTFKRNHAYTQDELGTGRDDDRVFSVERAVTMSHIWPTLHSPGAVRWSDTDPRKKAFYKELKIEHPKYGVVILEPTPTKVDLEKGVCSHYDFVSWHPIDDKKGEWVMRQAQGKITPHALRESQMKKAADLAAPSSPQIPSSLNKGRLPVVVGFPFDQGGSFDPALHRYPFGSGGAHEARPNHTHRTEFIKSLPAGGAFTQEYHMDKIDLLKSHIDAYTRSDGTVVQTHEDKRQAAVKPKLSASSVDVQGADRYEYANGKKPGGKGGWMFSPHRNVDFSKHKNGEDYYTHPHGSYTEAKAAAKKWAAEKGHHVIHIQT